jgi:hypothetical protein
MELRRRTAAQDERIGHASVDADDPVRHRQLLCHWISSKLQVLAFCRRTLACDGGGDEFAAE